MKYWEMVEVENGTPINITKYDTKKEAMFNFNLINGNIDINRVDGDDVKLVATKIKK